MRHKKQQHVAGALPGIDKAPDEFVHGVAEEEG